MNESLLMLINVATTNTAIAKPSTLPEAIEYHTLTTHMRTIPRKFVRRHQVHAYSRAILHFGHLQFRVLFRIKRDQDRREIDGDTRLHMITNWQAFLDENGLPEEKVLRLELHEEKFVLGENVHFELSTSKYVEVQLGCRLNSRLFMFSNIIFCEQLSILLTGRVLNFELVFHYDKGRIFGFQLCNYNNSNVVQLLYVIY